MTTPSAFVDALAALTVAGVSKNYGTLQPLSIPAANIPAMFIALPSAENAPWVATGGASISQTLSAEVYILAKSIVEGQPLNVSDPLTMLDNLVAALGAATALGRSKPTFRTRATILSLDGISYWAIVADVTVTG